jgi:hypothetical protein
MIKNIVIFSNCAGGIIKNMFENHSYTKDKYSIHCIANYENLNKQNMDDTHLYILSNCDILIYQPLNQIYSDSEYDIVNIKNCLKEDVVILKVNYYRFRGFWYHSEYNPYDKYGGYEFLNMKYYGIHDSFIDFYTTNKTEVIDKINNIQISNDELLLFFKDELAKFKKIDDNSDVDMYEYFINNYKTKHLFHDPFHPTLLFFYEMFRQIIMKLENYELIPEDTDFIHALNHIEMTHWALPILPIVKNILEIKLNDSIYIFPSDKRRYMNVYDYYYIRLSPDNFQHYLLSEEDKNIKI